MPHFPSRISLILSLAALLALSVATAAEDFIEMHPQGERLPFDHQGPFVTTSDGGVLAVGRSQAYVSHDEGKSWHAYPLFQDNDEDTKPAASGPCSSCRTARSSSRG